MVYATDSARKFKFTGKIDKAMVELK